MAKTKNPGLERQRKAAIVDSARRLLIQGSHQTTTLSSIAREAGVSKGLVTYYFDSKDEIIVEAIGTFFAERATLMHQVLTSDRSARDRLRGIIEATLPSREAIEEETRFQAEVWSFAKSRPEILDRVRASFLAFRMACESMVEAGVEEGYMTSSDVRWKFLVLHSLVGGLRVQMVVDPSLDPAVVRQRAFELLDGLFMDSSEDGAPTSSPR